jgi:hypothetical protein
LSVIRHEKLKPYFADSAEVKPEASIIMPEGTLLRPDRVILEGKEATILEFKTGHPVDWHARQVISYADALERMGYEKVKRILVYIDDQVTVEEL